MAHYVLYREDGTKLEIGDEITHKLSGSKWDFESILRIPYSEVVKVEASRADNAKREVWDFLPEEFGLTVDIDG